MYAIPRIFWGVSPKLPRDRVFHVPELELSQMDEVSTETSDGVRSDARTIKCELVGAIENWSGLEVDLAADRQKADGEFA